MRNKLPLYGLIGYPVTHSLSPRLFEQSDLYVRGARYELFPLQSLALLPELLAERRPQGLNVTSPYKERILEVLPQLETSSQVQRVGGANTLVFAYDAEGCCLSAKAYNTDVDGFRAGLTPLLTGQEDRALILGAGAAARAVASVLEALACAYCFVSRTPRLAVARLSRLGWRGAQVVGYDALPQLLPSVQILVNATPLGLAGLGAPEIPYELLAPTALVYDLNYAEGLTPCLRAARQYTERLQDGRSMLLAQAEASWSIWRGAVVAESTS